MSFYDYKASQEIGKNDPPFYALIMAAICKADTINAAKLRMAFPETYAEFDARYNGPAGFILPQEQELFEIFLRAQAEAEEPVQ